MEKEGESIMKERIDRLIKIILSLMIVFSVISLNTVKASTLYNISYNVTYGQTSARTMLSLINDLREDVGVDDLAYDYTLEQAAMQRAAEIAIYFSHDRPNEEDCFSVLDDYSISWWYAGENIAEGYDSVSSVFEGWSESEGHYYNMINEYYNAIGIGYCIYDDTTYWVQLFTYSTSLNTTATTANDSSTTVNVEVSTDIFETVCDAIGHSYGSWVITTKATTSSNGKKTKTCSVCGTTKTSTIKKISTVKLSTTTYTYNGKVKTPSVTVTDSSGNKLTKGTDYTVSYPSGRKKVGTYSVKITFKGNYSGSKTVKFKIKPKATTLKSLTASKKAITVKWTKKTTQTTGYQIRYSTSSSFSSYKTVTISSYKTTSKKITGLKSKKKYYVKIRTYKTVNGTKYYSSWSSIKSIKTK